MLIQSLEQKTRLALLTVFLAVTSCTVICAFTIYYAAKLITDERQQIYLIDGQIPFLAERSKQEANFLMEAKAHIQLFHQYFFNLPPDDDYIKWTLGKAMYMADATAMKQKQAMEENGFYSDIVSSSAVCTIICDSIHLNEETRKFTYYGTQLIKRRSRDLKRSIKTTGEIENVPRTQNNPHGLLITHWRTLENKDLDY
jgi:conjugative transposon TraK protein